MIKRRFKDTDGACFGIEPNGACGVLENKHPRCGTYGCMYYKPLGCEDWVRLDKSGVVEMIPPEEYYARRDENEIRRRRNEYKGRVAVITEESEDEEPENGDIGEPVAEESCEEVCAS